MSTGTLLKICIVLCTFFQDFIFNLYLCTQFFFVLSRPLEPEPVKFGPARQHCALAKKGRNRSTDQKQSMAVMDHDEYRYRSSGVGWGRIPPRPPLKNSCASTYSAIS